MIGRSVRWLGVWVKPKYYADACTSKGTAYYEYEKLEVDWGRQDDYESTGKIGRGKYSEVYEGVSVINHQRVVIKILKPVRTNKVQREVSILQKLKGGPNIIHLLDVVKDRGSNTPSLIMEHVNNADFRTLYPKLTDFEIRYYIYEVLKALDFTHSMGVIHRDIKPNNIMIDHPQRLVRIIDWGLAEFYLPGKAYHVRVASRYFKAPEFLVNYTQYDYSSDMWSLGAVLAGIVFRMEPFFHGQDNPDQLVKIAKVMGTDDLYSYMEKYKITLESHLYDGILGHFPRRIWTKFITVENRNIANAQALDLLDKMLVYDHAERITPREALQHDYFQPVAAMWNRLNQGHSFEDSDEAYATAMAIQGRKSQAN